MNASPNVVQNFFAQLTAPQMLAQVVVVIFAVAAALLASFFARRWWQQQAAGLPATGLHTSIVEGSSLLAPILLGLLVVLIGRGLFATQVIDTRLLDISMQLITALMLVRLATYLLRLVLGPRSWLRGYESKLTLVVWLALSFQLVGWFNAIENALDAVNLLPGKAHFSVWDLLKGLVVVTVFILVTSLVARAIEFRVMRLENLAMSTRIGVSKFTYVLLVSLGVLLGIRAAGVDLTALTVLTGAIGLGLGFGLQSIASNFVSGFVLLMDRSIKPGDVISFTGTTGTSTENFGWVQELRGRYVVVRDRDGVETLVPNQSLITNSVINWSYSDRRIRLKLPVRISYRDDPEVALRVLVESATNNPRILQDPAPVSRLMHFGESGMELELRFWISDPENGVNNVRSEVNRAIWQLFKQSNLTIPVTQREVHVHGSSGAFG